MAIHHIFIPLTVYALMICTVETSFQKDFFPRLIMLNANRLENSEFGIIELNCSSSRQSFGNGAEFIVNGQTIEHISFHNNKCYNSKIEECTTDNCQCFPSDNAYIYKFEYVFQYNELILGCQIRFSDNMTGSIMKAVISLKFNGTVSDFFEYDVKVFNKDKEDNRDQNKKNSSSADIFIWIPVMCGILLVISAIVIVITCRVFRNHANKKREKKKVEEIAMDKKRTKAFRYEKKEPYADISQADTELNQTRAFRYEKKEPYADISQADTELNQTRDFPEEGFQLEFLEERLHLGIVEETRQLRMKRSRWNSSERILQTREERHRRLREQLRLNYPDHIRQTREERRRFLRERPRLKYPDARHLIKKRSRRWYGKRIAELVEQDDAMDMRIQETILDMTFETEKELIRKTDRLKDTFVKDISWNIYTEIEDVNLDNIHSRIQGAIVDTILDQKQAIKNRAVTAMHNVYPVYHSCLDDRRSPLAAIFKHLGDDDSDDSDEIDVSMQNVVHG